MRICRCLAVTAALLTACSAPDRDLSSTTGGTMVIAAPEPDILLPPFVHTAVGRAITDVIYDHLAEIGQDLNTFGDGGFTPRLADHWTWAPDSLSIAFHLNPKARWHDGQPVRAGDVMLTYALYKDPQVGADVTPLLANVDSVTVRDSLTAVVWYKSRSVSQFADFVFQLPIMPEHLLTGVPHEQLRTTSLARKPVGSGRFRFVRWDPGTRIEIVADTANYRGRAKLDRVIWTSVPENAAGVAQLLAGQADVFEVLTGDQMAQVDSSSVARTVPYPSLSYIFMGMNLRDPKNPQLPHPIFGDRNLRRALSMAADRQAMVRNVFGAPGVVAHGPFSRSNPVADTTLKVPPYDPGHAAALLDSIGWKVGPDGIRVKNGRQLAFALTTPTSSKARMSYAVLLQEQLRKVGAKVDIQASEFNAFVAHQFGRDFDAILASQSSDPGLTAPKQEWSTAGITKDGANAVSYSNPRFDALLDSAFASLDPATVRRFTSRAYQQVIDDAPAIWLYDLVSVAGVHKRIRPTGVRADEWWAGLADWSIPPGERIDRDRIGLAPKRQ